MASGQKRKALVEIRQREQSKLPKKTLKKYSH